MKGTMKKWTRRTFIGAGTVAGGGFLLGVAGFTFAPSRYSLVSADAAEKGQLTTWITVTPDNIVTILIPHCEMGQGTPTALAMMAAEELEADWSLVRVQEAPALDAYANGYIVRAAGGNYVPAVLGRGVDYGAYKLVEWFGFMVTGGSTAVRGTGEYGMRVAGAAARDMLLAAAAKQWGVERLRMHGEALARDARRIRTHRHVRRARTLGGHAARAHEPRAQDPGPLHHPPHLDAAPGYPVQSERQRDVRHRLHHAGHALRGARDGAGQRRQTDVGGRGAGGGDAGREEGREAR